MTSKKLLLSWQDIEADCQTVAQKVKPQSVDLIVAITKGGLIPAVILANKYLPHPPIITLQLKEVDQELKANYQAKKVKLISPLNQYPLKGKQVLIVDDVADSGQTLKKAIQLVKSQQPQKLTILTLHFKPRTIVKPDIFARKIDNHVWITYPWE